MGTYVIPRNYKGESRILLIFTIKSLITFACGVGVGFLFYILFKSFGFIKLGWIFLALWAVIGYGIGAFKIPTVAGLPITSKIGGESILEIIYRYIRFKGRRKRYTYITTKEEDN